jgi:hypothetical protein
MELPQKLQLPMPDPMEPETKLKWTKLAHEHLPHPTYFPAGLAMGVTFFFWGLITSWVIALVGLGLFTAALAGWITDIRNERKRH